ncbi:MAG TPA: hypothetical protein DIT99_20765 [Candidatus Latescibacteria bacterium]|nr:hypothetical protein [Candidatus Latescibacterota bacterium]
MDLLWIPGISDIWIYNIEQETQIRLMNDGPGYFDEWPNWSPSGDSLIYYANTDRSAKFSKDELVMQVSDGSGPPQTIWANTEIRNTFEMNAPSGHGMVYGSYLT